ncbi:NAD(+)-specific glutamate dehydrogenase/putative NAD-specific glutamate dehydrogenase [Blumeria hordei DH14]|uniref:NAD-specific glutamate dehydrogenase n=1 Tax=Blumeria graminis f. sp. hordei (strain DH14) TaxID=546991 RepID=N1JG38_BLUG1|nr:NAD(+)-specific glutamate dehydrogenase/putative NAD-specific glutamate dehydrogenase [Blumeria hordei DH14]
MVAAYQFPAYNDPQVFSKSAGPSDISVDPLDLSSFKAETMASQRISEVTFHHDLPNTATRQPSLQPIHVGVPISGNMNKVLRSATVGYVAPEFKGKMGQRDEVKEQIQKSGLLPESALDTEIAWFYEALGIDDVYFQLESVGTIVRIIIAIYAAKITSMAHREKRQEIRLDMEATDHAIYIDTSEPGISRIDGPHYEHRLEAKYLDSSTLSQSCYRVETFRSTTHVTSNGLSDATMRCYFVYHCQFLNPNPSPQETCLDIIGDRMFLAKATKNTLQIYQSIIDLAVSRTGPVIEVFDIENSSEKRVVVAFRRRTALGIFSALSDLYHYYGVTSSRKYVEQFSNGISIISLYLKPAPNLDATKFPPLSSSIHQITKEISLLYCIPQNKFQSLFVSGQLSLQEAIYAHCHLIFVQHFLNRLGSEYSSLVSALDPSNNLHTEILGNIKRRLRTETFTADYILDIITLYPELVRSLYASFASTHLTWSHGSNGEKDPSRHTPESLSDDELRELITKSCQNEHEELVMNAFRTFNNALLKTNFYTPTKVALSFRLDPSFLPKIEYPQPLYGMFLVIGSEFRGFHLRFRDIARGGIRIVKSRNREAYSINARRMFDENYGLANTQQRKNKDIPEGGSKGVILLNAQHQDKSRVAFEKYIDSIVDLLIPASSPGIKNPIVDLYGRQEILFMGPDENTADLVDWATEHARKRGAPWWKSFFTGKSPKLGGIPHDAYGMTTLSVREFVTGIYRKCNLDPSQVRKMQTGGPDGDLGSNEILLSNEKYTSIVDGSGVLVDPLGIDHEELIRLAKQRSMISQFDTSKLSQEGYRVLIDENDVKLPNGEMISNGTVFRNTFHLRKTGLTDCFVPCGGRPESIDLTTVNKIIQNGKSTIPYIVEGANLFIAQDAKIRLEEAGCILFKDASANKGGVTSSSMEVLASLSFDDEGFEEHMCVDTMGNAPEFYKAYVKEVQEKIRENARLEFEAIWRESKETKVLKSRLSDTLSIAITNLDEELQMTELWNNNELRRSVLADALPKLLLSKIGLDLIIQRVPDSYLRAIFGSYLASRFVYKYGSSPSQFAFFDFMSKRISNVL